MIGTKIYKEYIEDANSGLGYEVYDEELYFKCATWCNDAQLATIEDKGDYYEVVEIPPYVPTQEELKKMFTDAIQNYLDTTAQERRYDNIFTAISYVNSTDEIFAREARACLEWRDKVWRTCYNILDEVEAGLRPIPTIEELIEELPKINWDIEDVGEVVK